MSMAEVMKTHNESEPHWKIHFLSRGFIVFITLIPEADIIFGQGHSMILSHTPILINFNDKKSKHQDKTNCIIEQWKWILYEKAKI